MTSLEFQGDLATMPRIGSEHVNRWMEQILRESAPIKQQETHPEVLSWHPGMGATGGALAAFFDKSAPLETGALEEVSLAAKNCANHMMQGMGAAAATTWFDTVLQNQYGTNVNGHDLFRPTRFEQLGIGLAAAAPIDIKLRIGLAAVSWLGGRVGDYYNR